MLRTHNARRHNAHAHTPLGNRFKTAQRYGHRHAAAKTPGNNWNDRRFRITRATNTSTERRGLNTVWVHIAHTITCAADSLASRR
eukprot:5808388-Lingulodinium_polyedra.AAC.1